MRLYLGAEAEDEAAVREVLEVPRELGGYHRGARERDGDGVAQGELFGPGRGDGEREERVVLGLAGPQAGEAKVFGGLRHLVDAG